MKKRSKAALAQLEDCGVDIHEYTEGTSCSVLGWEADLRVPGDDGPMVFRCSQDKLIFYRERFKTWAESTVMSLDNLESARGIMQFLSYGIQVLRAFAAPLSAAV